MYMNTFITRIITFLLIASIAGCGFQMRGTETKPDYLKKIYVTGQGQYSNFTRALKAKLISQGITVVDNAQSANLTLTVTSNNNERRTLTITRSNRTDEYQLISTVKFKVTTYGGSEVLPEKKIIVERVYVYDRDKVIGTEYEQDILEKEMSRDIIDQIITRLYAITEDDITNAKKPADAAKEKSKDTIKMNDVIDQQY